MYYVLHMYYVYVYVLCICIMNVGEESAVFAAVFYYSLLSYFNIQKLLTECFIECKVLKDSLWF